MKPKYLILGILIIITLTISSCNNAINNDQLNNEEKNNYENDENGKEETPRYELIIEIINDELENPWGIAFTNNNLILITEKNGEISLINPETEEREKIRGVPEVDSRGQGGLLDVEIEDEIIYLTYSARNEEGTATHLGRGILNLEERIIEDFEVLRVAKPYMSGGAHFGSRIILQDDYVYFSTGDRGRKDFGTEHVSQDTTNEIGTIIRLYKNGNIPETNPFYGEENIIETIYTYGHRNVQGMTIHPETKDIWISEHGERDGDAIHILEAGGNYGWPIAHHGCRYGTTTPVSERPEDNPNIINPVYYWECQSGGFPPAGMTFYTGDLFEEWQGNLFIGNLAGQYLGRFEVNGREVKELEPLLTNQRWRIRDVKESRDANGQGDGYLYIITDGNPGKLIRLRKSSP
jgi:aldose sugar dehydrogenase